MVRPTALAAALLLAACGQSTPGALEQAKSRYSFLNENGASAGELCDQAKRVAAIAADQHDVQEYKLWRSMAVIQCNAAGKLTSDLF